MKKSFFLASFFLSSFCHAIVFVNNPPTSGSSLPLPPGDTSYIQNTNSLQIGSTFYVSSGTIMNGTLINTSNFLAGAKMSTLTVVGQTISIGTSTPNQGGYAGNGLTIGSVSTSAGFFEMIRSGSSGASTLAIFRAGNTANSTSSGIAFKSGAGATQGQIVFQTSPGGAVQDRLTLDENGKVAFDSIVDASSTFKITGGTTDYFSLKIGTSTNNASFFVGISSNGHVVYNSIPPSVSSCGATPNGSVSGTDNSGTITVGGGVVTSCVLTFANSWGVSPNCNVSDNSIAVNSQITSLSPTAVTFSFSASLSGGQTYYQCSCNGVSCQ